MNLKAKDESTNLWLISLVLFVPFAAHLIINHKLAHLGVAPVGTDPCDGVNAFSFITIAFVAIASAVRRFRDRHSSSPLRYLYIVRSQQAVLFATFVALTAEIIALARNTAMWTRILSPTQLFALLGALAVVTVAAQLLILVRQRDRISLSSLRWTRTASPVVAAILILAVCPEWPTYSSSTTAHILTVALGAVVVMIPIRLLLIELVPNGQDVQQEATTFLTAREWTLLLIGLIAVLFSFFRHIPIALDEIAELLIACALLGAPLGIAGNPKNSIQNAHAEK